MNSVKLMKSAYFLITATKSWKFDKTGRVFHAQVVRSLDLYFGNFVQAVSQPETFFLPQNFCMPVFIQGILD